MTEPRHDQPRQEAGHETRHEPRHETADVRPYTVTGGRTRSSSVHFPLEALVETVDLRDSLDGNASGRAGTAGPEQRRILELADGQYLSIAELSAHLHLPLGVVRVLVGDLSQAGLLVVHTSRGSTATERPPIDVDDARRVAETLSVLESVLDGISAL